MIEVLDWFGSELDDWLEAVGNAVTANQLGVPAILLTEKECSAYLAIPVRILQRWRRKRRAIPYVKFGPHGLVRYSMETIVAWIRYSHRSASPRSLNMVRLKSSGILRRDRFA